jgi:type IV secretory pathway VirB10-like protein
MAKSKKAAGTKPISDVAHPGTSSPSDTSKPIITQRPIMKDPMVVEEGIDKSEETVRKPLPAKTRETKIAPLSEPAEDSDATPDAPEPAEETKPEEAAAEPEKQADESGNEEKPEKPDGEKKRSDKIDADAEAAAKAAEDVKLQKLVDSKKYFLPINAVEHRRSKRVVIGGVIVALVLAVAWADIALDAGLIQAGGVKPVTHFFSN